jgi:hypothetical protein
MNIKAFCIILITTLQFLNLACVNKVAPKEQTNKAKEQPNKLFITVCVGDDDVRDNTELRINVHFTDNTESGFNTFWRGISIPHQEQQGVPSSQGIDCDGYHYGFFNGYSDQNGNLKTPKFVTLQLLTHNNFGETDDNADIKSVNIAYVYQPPSGHAKTIFSAKYLPDFKADGVCGRLKGGGAREGNYSTTGQCQ